MCLPASKIIRAYSAAHQRVPGGTKDCMVLAGTKYEAMSLFSMLLRIFALRMPSRHFFSASKTPEPDFPFVSASLINVENFVRISGGINIGDAMLVRVIPRTAPRMTGAPTGGCS